MFERKKPSLTKKENVSIKGNQKLRKNNKTNNVFFSLFSTKRTKL